MPLEIVGAEDLCKPSCERVVVTFDPDVGGDTWLVAFNAVTHLPQMIQKQVEGGRVGYRLDGWVRVDGLAFATRITNIARPTEIYEYADVGVGVPRDEIYAPTIDRGQKIDSCNARPGARSRHRGCNF